jgi:hypothetical protein
MNENIIAWNVTNWITVVLMAAIGFFILGAGLKWKQSRGNIGTTSTTGARGIT